MNTKSFFEDIKKSIEEISSMCDFISNKNKENFEKRSNQTLLDFSESLESMKKDFERTLEKFENKDKERYSAINVAEERMDAIKPYFEKFFEKLKNNEGLIVEEVDIGPMKIKMEGIYTKIFLSGKENSDISSNKTQEKNPDKKEEKDKSI